MCLRWRRSKVAVLFQTEILHGSGLAGGNGSASCGNWIGSMGSTDKGTANASEIAIDFQRRPQHRFKGHQM